MANVTSNGSLKKQSQSNCNFFNLNCHQPAQLYRPEIIIFYLIALKVLCQAILIALRPILTWLWQCPPWEWQALHWQ